MAWGRGHMKAGSEHKLTIRVFVQVQVHGLFFFGEKVPLLGGF